MSSASASIDGIPIAGDGTPRSGRDAAPITRDIRLMAATVNRWGPVIVWMGVIAFLSTGSFSAQTTSGIIFPVLKFFLYYWQDDTLTAIHLLFRKMAHSGEYAILGALVYRALEGRARRWRVALTIVICAFYAGSDEIHQYFVASRTASARDVAIDTLGAVGMMAAIVVHGGDFGARPRG